jgi:tetratricopeptide (TPR) repeat protein
MAFDKNNTSFGMKIVIIVFAVVLVLTMCLPFFSSCSAASSSSSSSASDTASTSSDTSAATTTVAGVRSTYGTLISALEAKVEADAANLTPVVNLGNAYMDMGMDMLSASDYSDNEEEVQQVFLTAVDYYDTYLASGSSSAVTVDRTVCLFYAGEEDQAVADLEAFVEETPDYPMAWYNLGVFYQTQGDYDKATEAYNTVIELDPDDETGATSNAQYALYWIDLVQSLTVETTDDEADVDVEEDADGQAEADETDGADADGADAGETAEADEAETGDAE